MNQRFDRANDRFDRIDEPFDHLKTRVQRLEHNQLRAKRLADDPWCVPIQWRNRHHFAFEIEGREYLISNRDDPGERETYDVSRYSLEHACPALSLLFPRK